MQFQYLDRIEQRYSGQMTPAEAAAFDQQLSHDASLAAEWKEYQAIASAMEARKKDIRAAAEASRARLEQEGFFKETVRRIDEASGDMQDTQPESPLRVRSNKIWQRWAVAASFALLAGLGWFWGENRDFQRNQALVAAYQDGFQADSTEVAPFGFSDDSLSQLIERYLSSRQPDSALAVIAAIQVDKEESDFYYEGYAYFQKKDYDKALFILNELIQRPVFIQKSVKWKAQWVAALCYFETNREKEADKVLNSLISDDPNSREKEAYRSMAAVFRDRL